MIKNILFSTLFTMIGYCSFGQSGMYMVSERFSGNGTTDVSYVVATDPQGNTVNTNITHFMIDLEQHDSELNQIFNNISAQGYVMIDALPFSHGDFDGAITAPNTRMTRTWIFKVP